MTTKEDNFKKIDQDLDEGKKCCFACGLEQGYNIIGLLTWLSLLVWVYVAFVLYLLIAVFGLVGPLILGTIYTIWNFIIPIIWLLGFLARGRGDAPTFKKFVKIFFYMYVVNIFLNIVNTIYYNAYFSSLTESNAGSSSDSTSGSGTV